MNGVRQEIQTIVQRDWATPIIGQAINFDVEWEQFHHTYIITGSASVLKYYIHAERVELINVFCDRLFKAASDPLSCTENLEEVFQDLFKCCWRPEDLSVTGVTDEVEKLMRQLPQLPIELPGPLRKLGSEYFDGALKTWTSFKVVSHVHGNLIRFIVYRVITLHIRTGFSNFVLQEALNHVGELIQHCVIRSTMSERRVDQATWYVVRAFLWTFWQRTRVLHALFDLGDQLRGGRYEYGGDMYKWMRNFLVAPKISLRALTEAAAIAEKPPNLCGWAVHLLLGDPACLGLDFGILFRRFQDVFGTIPPSCRGDSGSACDGQYWQSCQRFYRPDTPNQSMHDQTWRHSIHDEIRITWNEASYRNVKGARAVDACSENASNLIYREASNRTLAISHVWSHGQGGRPELGINMCLHLRYKALAISMDCDSYWIDSACM